MKLTLLEAFNRDEENYFKIKVIEPSSLKTIEILKKFFLSLELEDPFYYSYTNMGAGPYKKSYNEEIGLHKYLENEKFKVHLVCAKEFASIFLKCSLAHRPMVMTKLNKYFKFAIIPKNQIIKK